VPVAVVGVFGSKFIDEKLLEFFLAVLASALILKLKRGKLL